MQNTISFRIADFLKRYPPFTYLKQTTLERLAMEVTIIYKSKNEVLFEVDEAPHPFFYVVHKGAVELWTAEQETVVDICDEGDIFGLRPLMANDTYRLVAKTKEETIIYAIPIKKFEPLVSSSHRVAQYLLESFASNTRNPYSTENKGQLLGDSPNHLELNNSNNLFDFQQIRYSKSLVSCDENALIQEVAEQMTKHGIGAILIEQNGLPKGIITDKDLRNKIATGRHKITERAKNIMTSPVITYPKKLTVTQAQMAMMKNNISHLILTQDGTPNSPAVGISSKHDLMWSVGNNPAVLVKAIKRSKGIRQIKPIRKDVMNLLRGYLNQNIPMSLIGKIISELNDVCMKRVVEICLDKMETSPPVKFAWLAMGSQGRSEQMLHTDQDNAMVFEDVTEDLLEQTRDYFLKLAKRITKALNKIGYEFCPADMMGSNPKWCKSLTEFKTTTLSWIRNPGPDEVLLSAIFFDYNRVYGDKNLVTELSDYIVEHISKSPIFLAHLAKSAMTTPSPSGFFRDFLVEQDGQYKDHFDLKLRALMPLIDAARVLILSHKVTDFNNTWERYEKLAELEPQNKELYLACSYASKALLRFRTKQGLRANDSGRFIDLSALNKEEKMKLKRTFKSIKEIQELVNLRFMVSRVL